MNTLTLFDAYAKACALLHETSVHVAANGYGLPAAEIRAALMSGRRLERQVAAFAAAIRARLTPPAPPRKRVKIVAIGIGMTAIQRTHDGAVTRWHSLTPASRARLLRACNAHMRTLSADHVTGGSMWTREVAA